MKKSHLFRKKSRTFSLAASFFDMNKLNSIQSLYFICRTLDDWTDSGDQQSLINFSKRLINKQDHELLIEYHRLSKKYGIDEEPLVLMVNTMLDESSNLSIDTVKDLIDYCKGVAGTVGWMMCPIIGAIDKNAKSYAIDLGIAMQLTNIARDIYEDALNERVYIPSEFYIKKACSSDIIQDIDKNPQKIISSREKLLDLADQFYRKAEEGFIFIPKRERLAVKWAALMYKNIGDEINRNPFLYLKKKAKISILERFYSLIKVVVRRKVF